MCGAIRHHEFKCSFPAAIRFPVSSRARTQNVRLRLPADIIARGSTYLRKLMSPVDNASNDRPPQNCRMTHCIQISLTIEHDYLFSYHPVGMTPPIIPKPYTDSSRRERKMQQPDLAFSIKLITWLVPTGTHHRHFPLSRCDSHTCQNCNDFASGVVERCNWMRIRTCQTREKVSVWRICANSRKTNSYAPGGPIRSVVVATAEASMWCGDMIMVDPPAFAWSSPTA